MDERARKEKWNQFVTEYYQLQEKYNVRLSLGCSYCVDDHKMDGQEVEYYKDGWTELE